MENGIRIQKVLSEQGIASRRKVEEWITQGKIKVNGRPAVLGQKINPNRDVVAIDGERVYFQKSNQKYYIMLHKPRGYVTTMSDELGRKCVAELVEDVPERVYPIGRLDKDSEGMLLFTNDGDFANLIMHPSHHVSKTYRVTVRPDISDAQVVQLSTGVEIDGKKTSPAHVTVLEKEPQDKHPSTTLCLPFSFRITGLTHSIGPSPISIMPPIRDMTNTVMLSMKSDTTPMSWQLI